MSETRGVFALSDAVDQKLDNTWVPVNQVWLSPSPSGTNTSPNVGYFAGGFITDSDTTDKVTFTNDTTAAVPGAFLSVGRSYLAASGNLSNGYFGGGQPGPTVNTPFSVVTL